MVNALIKKGANVKAVDKYGNTPLHLVASHYSDEGIVKALIENGADVNAKNQDRCTPLHCAVRGGYTRIVKALIENGEDYSLKNKNGKAPIDFNEHVARLAKEKEQKQAEKNKRERNFCRWFNSIIRRCYSSGTFCNRDSCS
ncbi:ankyrin repeat domain-containing protein [Wolbachia endosymbiont (group A) of Clivina fossor]|uniref:ankyrin repeat domain-containing protein n=1 Tax=Wolbachia endosymbiont (group A) of Clivina fossor TaxID=3066133 RepID=UPI003132F627